MRKSIFASIAAVALLGTPAMAWAQAPVEKEAPVVKSINLTLEQRHVIKELMKDSKFRSAPDDIHLAVGGKVPDSVALHPMPAAMRGKNLPGEIPSCGPARPANLHRRSERQDGRRTGSTSRRDSGGGIWQTNPGEDDMKGARTDGQEVPKASDQSRVVMAPSTIRSNRSCSTKVRRSTSIG